MKFTSDPDLADWLIDSLFLYLSDVQVGTEKGTLSRPREEYVHILKVWWATTFFREGRCGYR
jgi:hypothetical protein